MKSAGASTLAGALGGSLGVGSVVATLKSSTARANQLRHSSIPAGQPRGSLSADLSPYTGSWGDVQLRHVLRRTMFGVPESQFLAAQALGSMDAVVNQLLACQDLTTVPLPTAPASWLTTFPSEVTGTTAQMNRTRLQAMERQQIENWWFDQMVQENLSIRQRLTLMWTNHFVTGSLTVLSPQIVFAYLMLSMQYALGNFKDFAYHMSISDAMLLYLNGNQNYYINDKSSANENYARELMELFTLGILFPGTNVPNYTETDIQNSALALTGWQLSNYKQPPVSPFQGILWDGTNGNPNWHNTGTKTFLGQSGNFALTDILAIIFQQPTYSPASPAGIPTGYPSGYTSAYWVSQKLYQEFVYYVPNTSVVDAMARLLIQNNFEIAPVMQALLTSAHFYDASVIGAQLKSPAIFAGSLVREFGLTYPAFNPEDPPQKDPSQDPTQVVVTYEDPNPALSLITYGVLNVEGQELLNPPNVKGWPGGHNWVSTGTFQAREASSYASLNNAFSKGYSLSFDPSAYGMQVPNATSSTAAALGQALENMSLAFTLGPLESGDLLSDLEVDYKDPTYQFDPNGLKLFAPALALLPEFQLF